MGVSSQILIDRPREGVHLAGEPVTGVVRYYIDATTEYSDVTLSFLGKAKCQWSEGSMDSSSYYRGKESIVTQHVNVTNKAPEDTVTLQPGSYEHLFEFYLPEDIPSSFKDATGAITYKIQLKFVKAGLFSFKRIFTVEITVYGSVSPPGSSDGLVIFGLEKPLAAPFSAKKAVVYLKAEIERTRLTPGDNVRLAYVVTNDTDVTITSVKTELYCVTTYTADCTRTHKIEKKVRDCESKTEPIPKRKGRRFSVVLPTRADLYSIQHSRVISREYRVRATVRLPLPHINACVEMPVAVGESAGAAADLGVVALEDSEPGGGTPARADNPKPSSRAGVAQARARPPSYWQAMYEEKAS